MKTEKIGKRNIIFKYNLPEWNLNLHLILGQRYNYIIDTGLGSESVEPMKEYLGNDPKPIIVINTHYHWDHIWGNHCFNGHSIISHRHCRRIVKEKWSDMLSKNKSYIRGEVKLCLPNLVFEDCIHFPDDGICVFHTPGHTIDSISVFDQQDRVLNAGDNIGDTPEEIVPSLKTSEAVYLHSLQRYRELDAAACISGHNDILGPDVFHQIESALPNTTSV